MSLQCGIIGLTNIGKSTCLNALSQVASSAQASNYLFCTIEPNQSIVPVPDLRLEKLAQVVGSENIIPTTVKFLDIAGLVKNAAQGAGLGNKFLADIRNADALIHVVRCFEDPEIIHVAGKVDPLEDIDTIDTELILADLSWIERMRKSYQKSSKSGDTEARKTLSLLALIEKELNNRILLRQIAWEPEIKTQLIRWGFLTILPMIYLANVSEEGLDHSPFVEGIQAKADRENTKVVTSCVKLEADLIGTSEEEKKNLLALLGGNTLGLGQLIREAYDLLGLQTFFTAGPKEVRAWTVLKGSTAWEAAGRIHSDFQRGFIAAEVVGYDDFMLYQGIKGAKAAGKWRAERKEYIVKEGDIIYFQFNV
jgi:ribosome-binding ATPase